MSIAVTENLVDTLKVSLNPTIVTEVGNGEHADAILECFDGKRFFVVRRELALCSDFFKGLFTHSEGERRMNYSRTSKRFIPTTHPVYRLPTPVISSSLGQVIGFISEQSLESLELSEDNVAELVVLADFLGIQDIIEECSDYMLSRITIDNVCGVWQFSLIYRIQNVEHKSFKFLCNHFTDICLQEEFLTLRQADVSKILVSYDLGQARYEDIWKAIVAWCEQDNSRKIFFKDLIKNINFGFLDPEFCTNNIINHSLFKAHVDIDDVINDTLVLFGGDTQHSRSLICYNGETDTWRRLPFSLPDPLHCPGDTIQVVLVNHHVFIKRSVNCYLFDWRRKDFEFIGTCERRLPAIVEHKGEVHLFGGSFLPTWMVFNVDKREWRKMWPNMREGRSGSCGAVVQGKFYVLGGQTIVNKTGVKDCEMYNESKQCWIKIAPMTFGRSMFATVVMDNQIYVLGGQDEDGKPSKKCEKYCPYLGQWSSLPDMLYPRQGHVAVVLDQVVFVIGGDTETAEWFDTESMSWVQSASLPHVATGHGGCVINWQSL